LVGFDANQVNVFRGHMSVMATGTVTTTAMKPIAFSVSKNNQGASTLHAQRWGHFTPRDLQSLTPQCPTSHTHHHSWSLYR